MEIVGGAGSSGTFFRYRQPDNTLAHVVCEAPPRQEESTARPYYEPSIHESMNKSIHHSLIAPGLVTPTFVLVGVEVGHTDVEVLYPTHGPPRRRCLPRNPRRGFWHRAGGPAHGGSC